MSRYGSHFRVASEHEFDFDFPTLKSRFLVFHTLRSTLAFLTDPDLTDIITSDSFYKGILMTRFLPGLLGLLLPC